MGLHNKPVKGFSIRQRIMLGFLLLVAISGLITALNIFDLRDFHQHFKQYQSVSSSTNKVLEIDAGIADLQRAILAYGDTDNGGDLNQAIILHQQISQHIAQLIKQDNPAVKSNLELLEKLQVQVDNLKEKIESLQVQRQDRKQIIEENLNPKYELLIVQINSLFDLTYHKGSNDYTQLLWQLRSDLSPIRIHSARYFSSHAFQDKQIILAAFNTFKQTIEKLQRQISDKSTLYLLSDIEHTAASANETFHKAVQADRNYLFLVNIVIAGESAEIANVSDLLKEKFIHHEQEVFKFTEQESYLNQQIAIIASLLGALLAIVIAFVIGKKISDPLVSITNTFSKLAQGEHLDTIPATDRADEIGRLAKAANVFRETNLRTQELLEQTQEFAHELEVREKALESAAEKAREASVAKSQFLANMSHELRTPMNAILGMLALLHKTELNTRQDDYVYKTEGAARSLLSLLNDILDLSKAEAGKIELDPIAFDLKQLFQDLNVILSTSSAKKTIELKLSMPADMPCHFVGDALRLQQVLINLGSNAVKFTEQGEVEIAVSHELAEPGFRKLTFSIKDSGIGIAPENLAKIFSGFTQAEASTTRRFGGTGLGLAISLRLVSLMGGQLQVESELDKGSRFFFSIVLPELNEQEIHRFKQEQTETAQLAGRMRLAGFKILLVEDNLTNQQIAMELLELEGANVTCANHGQEALGILTHRLATIQRPGFDVVLMDLQMPVMDGISATHAIRHKLRLTSLPIIAMTANAMVSDREACLSAGMNDHVGKPFDINQLIQVLYAQTGRDQNLLNSTIANPEIPIAPSSSAASGTDPLIDLPAALSRLGGNKDLYRKMLPRFSTNLESLPAQLHAHLLAHDYSAAARLLHSLKGLSSTMGFMKLSHAAARAEKQFKSDIKYHEANEAVLDVCKLIEASQTALLHIDDDLRESA